MKKILFAVLMIFSSLSLAEPTSLKLIVPFAVGGPVDKVARALQPLLSQELQIPVVIEYKTGVGGSLGITSVAQASGKETVLVLTTGAPVIATLLRDPSPFNADQLVPLANLGHIPFVLVSSNKFGIKNLESWRKIDPTRPVMMGSVGLGSATHTVTVSFEQKVSKNIVTVPYKGQSLMITDLISGNIDGAFLFSSMAIELVKANKILAVAVTSQNRLIELPDVPTLRESGMTDLVSLSWLTVFSNRSDNTQLVKRVQQALIAILRDPARIEKIQQTGVEMSPKNIVPPNDFLDREKHKWAKFKHLILEQNQ